MLAEAKSEDLLYVGDGLHPFAVSVYNYKSDKFVGQLSGSFYEASGMCVDKKGDVWITSDYTSQVIEYAHGGTSALQTLSTNGTPTGCSISPGGDLAVTNHSTQSGPGDIQIWKNASGTPTSYSDPNACYLLWPAGYDNRGNLYVESQGYVCELPAGGNALSSISFNRTIYYPSSIMWDGKYITLTDQKYDNGYSTGIYRAAPTADGGLRAVGVTVLQPAHSIGGPVSQPFFVGKKNTPANDEESKVILGIISSYSVTWIEYYRYTSGKPFRYLVSYPVTTGQAVSLATK